MQFEGAAVLVIGSATGMGRATVARLVHEGAHVIAFDILGEKLAELQDELKEEPGTIYPFVGDVNDQKKRDDIIAYAKEEFGVIDALVYVAGTIDMMTPIHDVDDELWDYVMDVNLNSAFRIIRDALPLLENHEDKPASIVSVASVGGVLGSTAGPAYIASKHAILGLMKNLAWTLREKRIRVNSVNPGMIATSITENALRRWPDREPIHEKGMDLFVLEGATTLGTGSLGEAEDIARAICFLLSEEAKFINGVELTVDGGWTAF
jgi:NAD(P)-dependent dehydrogenase (short-subunit alcohol dehydrogenase family)